MIIYISEDDNESSYIKSNMTDLMWSSVVVKYTKGSSYLELSNKTKITDHAQIIQILRPKTSIDKLRNFSSATKRALEQFKSTGYIKADTETLSARRALCASCPFQQLKMFNKVCSQCGCHINSKTMILTEKCPIDKW